MFRKKQRHQEYDKDRFIPVIRCSICTGEQAAGFKDIQTGRFEEIMLIRDEKDQKAFMERYGVREVQKEY